MQDNNNNESATEGSLLKESIQLCKNNIFERIIAPCYNGNEIDINKLKGELQQYKPTSISGDTAIEKSFSQIFRQIEHNVVVHLAAELRDEHTDINMLAAMYDKIDMTKPIQGAAPYVHVEVVSRVVDKEKGKPTLTRFDALAERTTINLILIADKHGRLVNPNTNSVWVKGSNGHYVCIGSVKGAETGPITQDIVAFCQQHNKAYDSAKVAK